ncbi:TolB family protein [Subtercola boreus]|uniref:Gram-positive cocci surface proteins LPxTG domain-containing protein n=1 Tax=Subtercola boreus TaxID=120213 RepID=A0A3E0WGN0_9MICO|nr:PD40 domain-containing protein [Subtercola boreus]RFA23615.1 hypothetical protein B7R24_01705 [Subtercola boreus]RFA24009.1 hypothetical protein B7R23_01705 [Subtercola boreus]RFA29707.1 hypothetical protein B7R25_01700 [Subtercola boreus]
MPHLALPRPRSAVALGVAALALGAAGLLASGSAFAALPAPDTTAMVSVTPLVPSTAGNNISNEVSVSGDGRFVAFTSLADNLVGIGSHDKSQVYKRDLLTGTTTLVSAALIGVDSGTDDSTDPSISADGRYVSFTSMALNLGPSDDPRNVHNQIFVRDTLLGTTRELSLIPGGLTGGDDDSTSSSISADGSKVAFQSAATDLLVGVTTTDTQVYLAPNVADPVIQAVSLRDGASLRLPDDDSLQPAISGDGNTVAFVSAASNLAAVPGNGSTQVYTRTLSTSTTKLLSFTSTDKTMAAHNISAGPSVSFDGSRVAYQSKAADLIPESAGIATQVIVFDRSLDANSLVSFNRANTGAGTGISGQPSISADGNAVAFASLSDLTAVPGGGLSQVYRRDLRTKTTTIVSVQAGTALAAGTRDSLAPALSGDGNFVGFTSSAPSLTDIATRPIQTQTYLRAAGAAAPPTAPATPTATTTPAPPATGTPGTGGSTGSGQGGSGSGGSGSGGAGGSGSGHLASTGMSQAPIMAAGVSAAVLALVGGSILFGARAARRRRLALGSAGGSGSVGGADAAGVAESIGDSGPTPSPRSTEHPTTGADE